MSKSASLKNASLDISLDTHLDIPAPSPPCPEAGEAPLSDADIFSSFYQNILATDNLPEFEKYLFAFMYEVLGQNSCLLYTIAGAGMGKPIRGKQIFTLQRGSYCGDGTSSVLMFKYLPKMVLLDVDALGSLQDNQTREPSRAAMSYFFAIADQGNQSPLYSFLCEYGELVRKYIRCGMVLGDQKNIFGILLYEKPVLHSYLDKPLRLQQFREFLTLALNYRHIFRYATQDQLTGLYRKYYFLRLAEHRLCEPEPEAECQLLIMDIDYFKNFNDTYGHLKGDECLRAIGDAILHSVRTHDFAGRFGGEEFMCLVSSSLDQVLSVSDRIHETISHIQLFRDSGQKIPAPTISIGIASFESGESVNQLVGKADKALYRAKQSGRNQTIVFGESMASE